MQSHVLVVLVLNVGFIHKQQLQHIIGMRSMVEPQEEKTYFNPN
jgi:hypothetical protein